MFSTWGIQKSWYVLASLIAVLLGFGKSGISRLAAQATTATILGAVTDSSGAIIAGATLQVRNVETGRAQSTQSDAQGRFNVPDLAVGNYEVQASRDGF